MILFRCPACGTAHRADPQYAGGTMPCRRCGTQVPIPRQSDPACVLVYKAGDAEEGVPMTADEVRLKLVSGELAETDLLWDSNTWKPLSQVFGGVRQGETEGLRLKRRDEPDKQGPTKSTGELDTSPRPSGAVQTVDMSEVEAERKTETQRKRLGLLRRGEAKGEAPAQSPSVPPGAVAAGGVAGAPQAATAQAAPAAARSRHGRPFYIIQSALLIFALVAGYKFGVGPLISQYRDTPTYIVVHNHEDVQYTATLGWRRLKEDIGANTFVNYEVWVGMPERHTLRIVPTTPGAGAAYSLQVPVRPGGATLVNLKQKGEYGVYELKDLAGKALDSPEVRALATEVGSNRAPDSALKVSRQIRDFVGPAFKGTRQDLFFRSSTYEIDKTMLYKLRDHEIARNKRLTAKGKEPPPEPPAPAVSKPMVTFPAARNVAFANGSGLHDPDNKEKVDRTIALPLTAITLSSGNTSRILKVGSPRLTMGGDDKALRLAIQLPNMPVSDAGKNFVGPWEYRAECPLEGRDANRWRWNWVYKGTGESSGRRYGLDIKVEMDGKESRSIRPL